MGSNVEIQGSGFKIVKSTKYKDDTPAGKDEPDLADRVITAILSVVFVVLSLLFVLRLRGKAATGYALRLDDGLVLLLLLFIVVPAGVGFFLGSARMSNLLGHAFGTEINRKPGVTALIWLVVVAFLYLAHLGLDNTR